MKAKKKRIHNDSNGDCAFYVDLNDPVSQEKIVNYLKFGVPSSDSKHGHHVRLQCKVTPIQGDILASLREKAPPGYWKSNSDLMRSLVALGGFVAMKFLNNAEQIKSLNKEFKLLDMINLIEREVREVELSVQTRKSMHNINVTPFDPSKELEDLQSARKRSRG